MSNYDNTIEKDDELTGPRAIELLVQRGHSREDAERLAEYLRAAKADGMPPSMALGLAESIAETAKQIDALESEVRELQRKRAEQREAKKAREARKERQLREFVRALEKAVAENEKQLQAIERHLASKGTGSQSQQIGTVSEPGKSLEREVAELEKRVFDN